VIVESCRKKDFGDFFHKTVGEFFTFKTGIPGGRGIIPMGNMPMGLFYGVTNFREKTMGFFLGGGNLMGYFCKGSRL